MIKKGKQNLYPGSIQSNDTSTYSNDTSAARRSSTAAVNGYSNGDARRSSVTKPFASTASNDDNNTNNNSLPSKPTPTAAVDRGNFQSPPLGANADAGSFDFFGTEDSSDPFAEPSSMPATKPSSIHSQNRPSKHLLLHSLHHLTRSLAIPTRLLVSTLSPLLPVAPINSPGSSSSSSNSSNKPLQ